MGGEGTDLTDNFDPWNTLAAIILHPGESRSVKSGQSFANCKAGPAGRRRQKSLSETAFFS